VGIVSQFTNRGKIGALFDVLNWQDHLFDIDTFQAEEVAAVIDRILAARDQYLQHLCRHVEPLQRLAAENARIAKALLDRTGTTDARSVRDRAGATSER
jgi:hypothetical protein